MSNQLYTDLQTILSEKSSKIIPENIKKGISIFGIDGSLESGSSDVKLFETIEDMQSDSNPKEGDLALVYGDKLDQVHNGIIVNTVIFPTQVILEDTVSSSITGLFTYDEDYPAATYPDRWQFTVELTDTTYRVYRAIDNRTIVEYTSNDGITYNRITELTNNEYTFDLVDRWYAKWSNTILDNFCKTTSIYFGGLFQYGTERNNNYLELYSNIVFGSNSTYTADKTPLELTKIRQIINKMYETDNLSKYYVLVKNEDIISLYQYSNGNLPGVIIAGSDYYRISQNYTDNPKTSVDKYVLDLNNLTYTKTTLSALSTKYQYQTVYETIPVSCAIGIIDFSTGSHYLQVFGNNSSSSHPVLNTNYKNIQMTYAEITQYNYAPTQLSLNNDNQLYPGVTGYGKGLFSGDGSIWDNMTYLDKLNKIWGKDNLITGQDSTLPINFKHNVSSTSDVLNSNAYLVPVKLSTYDPNSTSKKITLYKDIVDSHDIYTLDKTKILHQDKSNNRIQILDAISREVLFSYTDIVIDSVYYSGHYGEFIILSNNDVIFYSSTDTTLYVYKLNLHDNTLSKTEIIPGGTYNKYDPFRIFAYNRQLERLYVGIKLDTVTGKTAKYEVGYIDTNTLEYTSILSKTLDYTNTAYLLEGCITSRGNLLVTWWLYPSHEYGYLIDGNTNNILVSKEDVSSDLETLNGSTYTLFNYGAYEDDNYIYISDTKRVNKATLAVTSYDSKYPRNYDFDLTYGFRSNIVYSLSFEKIGEINPFYNCNIQGPDFSTACITGIQKNGDNYEPIALENTCILDGSYNYIESSLNDYDILLINPSIARTSSNGDSSYLQYNYIDHRLSNYDNTITPQEYITAVDTTNKILGE